MFGCCSSYKICSIDNTCLHTSDPDYSDCKFLKNKKIYGGKSMEIKITISNINDIIEAISKLTEVITSVGISSTIPSNVKKDKTSKTTTVQTSEVQTSEVESLANDTLVQPTKNPVKKMEAPKLEPITDVLPDILEPKKEEPTFTFEEVKAKFTVLVQAGKQAQMKAYIESKGWQKISDIPREAYASVMADIGKEV